MESSDTIVLQNCCHSLSFLATADHTRQDDALSILHQVLASLRKRLDELAKKRAEDTETRKDDIEESGKIDLSIGLVIHRIAVLSKRWPLADLIDEGDEDEDAIVDKLCDQIFRVAGHELEIRKPIMEGDKFEIPGIWKVESKSHKPVAETVVAALEVLLSAAAWAVRKMVAELQDSSGEMHSRAKGGSNILVEMRQRVDKLVALCFEQYVDDSSEVSEEHFEFSETVQIAAGRTAGDLRSLLPRAFKDSVHVVLREAALVDDNHLIGGYVRFFRQQEKKVCEVTATICLEVVLSLLLHYLLTF